MEISLSRERIIEKYGYFKKEANIKAIRKVRCNERSGQKGAKLYVLWEVVEVAYILYSHLLR